MSEKFYIVKINSDEYGNILDIDVTIRKNRINKGLSGNKFDINDVPKIIKNIELYISKNYKAICEECNEISSDKIIRATSQKNVVS